MRIAIQTGIVIALAAGAARADDPRPPVVTTDLPTVAPVAKDTEGTGVRVRATDGPTKQARRKHKPRLAIGAELEARIEGWPEVSRDAVVAMYERYGEPAGHTANLVQWHHVGPWQDVMVSAEPVDHAFPFDHLDVLTEVIAFDVPADKFGDLALFDGSIVANRTRGELAASSDCEAMNFLMLNLAHDVIVGKRTAVKARGALDKAALAYRHGLLDAMTNRLIFDRPHQPTGDPDRPTAVVAAP